MQIEVRTSGLIHFEPAMCGEVLQGLENRTALYVIYASASEKTCEDAKL